MALGYTWEKLQTTVQILMGAAPLADRLQRALLEAAVLDRDEGAFPNAELRERWRILMDTLTHGRPRAEWRATIDAMSDDDRELAAFEWLSIFVAIDRLDAENDASWGRTQ